MIQVHVLWYLNCHFAYDSLATSPILMRSRFILPRGPSISTVRRGLFLIRAFRFDMGGSKSRKSTSGGRDRGAMPIRDVHRKELLNGRVEERFAKAGIRNSGREDVVRHWDAVFLTGWNMVSSTVYVLKVFA